MKEEIEFLIKKFSLVEHPEGGFYRETYRSSGVIPKKVLKPEYSGSRNYATSIYFLLTSDNFSALHKINQDEIWNYHNGSNLYIHCIFQNGNYKRVELGMTGNALPQYVVPAGTWFASSVVDEGSYSLVGCTVAPGFDFDDFELGNRDRLTNNFPAHEGIIRELTRD